MSLIIRPLAPQDRSEWGRLWTDYLAFYETTRPTEVFDATFARLLDMSPQWGFLAEHDGQAVGLAHYIFHAHNWHLAQVCYLQDLFAAPEARGQGVGRKLVEAVYDAADAADAADTYWLTQEFNTEARKLYDRIGAKTPFIKYHRGDRS